MHNKSRKDKKIIQEYKETLDELVKFKNDALKQIEDNPFLRRKWSWVDCIVMGVPMSKMPPTPYEEMINKINKRFNENIEQLKLNAMAKIEVFFKYNL